MKNNNIKLFLIAVSLFYLLFCEAQTITVKSISMQPSDLTAVEHPVFDINGDTCALLKIKTDYLEGIEFSNSNQYVKANYENGIYSVYVPAIGRKLDFRHKDYLSGTIDMGEYGYKRLKGGKTYLVTLDALRVSELKSTIVFKVEPIDAIVSFNGKNIDLSDNGVYEIPVSQGSYNYEVKKDNFEPLLGTVNVEKAEAKSLPIKLKPILHKCQIKGNVSNARILVDNIDYGKTGTLFLPQGQHNIRIQADGYMDCIMDVNIMSSMEIPYTMNENSIVTEVHATPVIIHSSIFAKTIYKNNKKIKDWYNGKEIMFMPGKYLLTDDQGNKKEIIVGANPLEVYLSDDISIPYRQDNANNNDVNNSGKTNTTTKKEISDNHKNNSYNEPRSNSITNFNSNNLPSSYQGSTQGLGYSTSPSRYNSTPSRGYSTSPSRYNSTPSRGNNTSPSRYNSTPSRSYSTSPSRYNSTPSRGNNTSPSRYNSTPNRSIKQNPLRGSRSPNSTNPFGSGSSSDNNRRRFGGQR